MNEKDWINKPLEEMLEEIQSQIKSESNEETYSISWKKIKDEEDIEKLKEHAIFAKKRIPNQRTENNKRFFENLLKKIENKIEHEELRAASKKMLLICEEVDKQLKKFKQKVDEIFKK